MEGTIGFLMGRVDNQIGKEMIRTNHQDTRFCALYVGNIQNHFWVTRELHLK